MSEKKKIGIVERWKIFFNLGEAGKIESFFKRVIKDLERAKEVYSRNIENTKFNSEKRLADLTDELEDAQEELEAAYMAVGVENVDTNDKQKSYTETYLRAIEHKEEKVENIELRMENEKESTEKLVKDFTDQIKACKFRINKITK